MGAMDSMHSGDIVSRIVNDTDSIRLRSTNVVVDFVGSSIMIAGSGIMMIATEWKLGPICIALVLAESMAVRIVESGTHREPLASNGFYGSSSKAAT